MSRGGQRKGAGRKSSWASGAKFEETVLIRVPKRIKDEVLAIAHQLDSMESSNLTIKAEHQEEKDNTLKNQTITLNCSITESNTPIQLDLLTDLRV